MPKRTQPDQPVPANGGDAIRRLIDLIVRDNLPAGAPLPSVRELSIQWGIGRNAVRDGFVRAQTLGLVEIRPRSGVVVRTPDYAPLLDALSQTMLIKLRQEDPGLVHLWDARAILEAQAAAGAARRRLPEDLRELRRCLEEMERHRANRPRFVEADERFHLAIARVAGNPVLRMLLDALLKMLRPDRLKFLPTRGKMTQTKGSHEAIYRAIATGDADRASQAVAEHIQRRVRYLLEHA